MGKFVSVTFEVRIRKSRFVSVWTYVMMLRHALHIRMIRVWMSRTCTLGGSCGRLLSPLELGFPRISIIIIKFIRIEIIIIKFIRIEIVIIIRISVIEEGIRSRVRSLISA